MGWPTAQTVLAQAGIELGLIQRASDLGENAYVSDDPNVIQLCAFLKKAGRDLVDESDWTHLRQEYAILTQSAAAAVAAVPTAQATWGLHQLPPDWRMLLGQTGWNRTSRFPMGGPLSEQEWQFVSARQAGVVINALFRPRQGLLYLYPPASFPAGQELVMAYKSAWWVQQPDRQFLRAMWAPSTGYNLFAIAAGAGVGIPFQANYYRCVRPGVSNAGAYGPDPAAATAPFVPTGSGAIADGTCVWNYIGTQFNVEDPSAVSTQTLNFGTADAPLNGLDVLMFEEELLVAKLKLLWLNAKGFDSIDAEREYRRSLLTASGADSYAPVLSLSGGGTSDRLLGLQNIPITGYGS